MQRERYAETVLRVTGVIPLQDNFGTSVVRGKGVILA
jgi:hypothetical protein